MTISATKYLFAAVGLGMLLGAFVAHHRTAVFVSHASRAQGTVTALVPQRSGDSNSVSYRPIVRFEHEGREVQFSDSLASSPPAYYVGQTVGVLYLAHSPADARIDSFSSLWFVPALLTGMGLIFFGIGGGLILVPALTQRVDERLVHEGRPLEADFQGVSVNSGIAINGRCPYRVNAQWVDPATSRTRVFQSHNVWFDPTAYVKDRKLKVFVDPNDPDKYYVDLSFLPKLAV